MILDVLRTSLRNPYLVNFKSMNAKGIERSEIDTTLIVIRPPGIARINNITSSSLQSMASQKFSFAAALFQRHRLVSSLQVLFG